MIRQLGLAGLGQSCTGTDACAACNSNPVMPEWAAVSVPAPITATAGPATAGPATLGAPVAPSGFDYTAAGVSYQGTPIVSWVQLALGLLALRGSG